MNDRSRGSASAIGLAVVLLLSSAGLAHAEGQPGGDPPVVCAGSECSVTVGSPGQPGASRPGGTRPVAPAGSTLPPPNSGSLLNLDLFRSLYASGMTPAQVADLYGRAPLAFDPVTGEPLRWLASGGEAGGGPPGAGPVVVSPAQLAQVAVSQLRLPSPVAGTSPSGDQVVRVPTWLWVDRSVWAPVSATAQVPGVSVTATAVPVAVVWSMGTGDSVTCQGPGTPYAPGVSDAAAASPDCGYTYARSSAGQSRERFAVSVTVSWRVSWAGGGQSGTVEGLSTRAGVDLRVREVQAVIVNPAP